MKSTIVKKMALAAVALYGLSMGNVYAQRAVPAEAMENEGAFRMNNLELPEWDIIAAGPGRDGIPAIDAPIFTEAKYARKLAESEVVLGISINGVAKAYPVRILSQHEIVNDNFGNTAVVVSYSPLCGAATAYKADGKFEDWQFAVSGLLYNNNLLMFDRQTESLWSQLLGRAVAGPAVGQSLEKVPYVLTTWQEWTNRHPQSMVLTTDTGFGRNYDIDPYEQYSNNDRLMFPLNHIDKRLPLKHRVLGIEVNGKFRAYPYSLLAAAENNIIEDQFNGQTVTIEYLPASKTALAVDETGQLVPAQSMYWFAWAAFHPQTEIYAPANRPTGISMNIGSIE